MCPEERRMMGKKYSLDELVEEDKNIPDKGDGAEVAKKTVNKVDNIGVDGYCVCAGGNGEGVKPSRVLSCKQEAYQKECEEIVF